MTAHINEFPKHPHPHIPAPQEPRRPQVQAPTVFVYEKQAWEYKVMTASDVAHPLPTEDELNTLGKEGWELVGVTAVAGVARLYLKRTRR